jgi:chemotaxis protein methyltransferase CheR
MRAESAGDGSALAHRLKRDPDARRRFRASVAISVSGSRRDPQQFHVLERDVLPTILEREGSVRVWSAGCADGSELYDVGGLLQSRGALDRSYLLGSDILEENLRRALKQEGTAAPAPVRARVRWEKRDLVTDPPPPGAWRLILCRNLAIYLRPGVRDDLHRKLTGALAPGGFLMLGRSERIRDPAAIGMVTAGPNVYRRPA